MSERLGDGSDNGQKAWMDYIAFTHELCHSETPCRPEHSPSVHPCALNNSREEKRADVCIGMYRLARGRGGDAAGRARVRMSRFTRT